MSTPLLDDILAAISGSLLRAQQIDSLAEQITSEPSLASALVERLITRETDETRFEDLSELLSGGLNAARMATESGQKAAARFIEAATEALISAAGEGRLDIGDSLIFSQVWLRAGLTPPDELRIWDTKREELAGIAHDSDPLTNLLEDCRHDPFRMHSALKELMPAAGEETGAQIIHDALTRPGEVWGNLGCLFLLDEDPAIRLIAATSLRARAEGGLFAAATARDCVLLRSWMPADPARDALDAVLRSALRGGLVLPETVEPDWTVEKILASVPDGVGAMTLCACLRRGGRLTMAFVLSKAGFGVRDAYSVACDTLQEQQTLEDRFVTGTAALPVTKAWFTKTLASAVAEGLEAGLPPAPGLIGIASMCGLDDLHPHRPGLEEMIDALPGAARIGALAAQAKTRLIRQSEHWPLRHPLISSWFECQDEVLELAELPPAMADRQLWAFLESRRPWWARRIAETAGLLEDAGHKDADSFTAVAMALAGTTELKKLPVMQAIHHRSTEYMESADAPGAFPGLEDVAFSFDELPEDALEQILQPSGVTQSWLEGFLLAVVLAPKRAETAVWLGGLIAEGLGQMPPGDPKIFIELVLSHHEQLCEDVRTGDEIVAALARLPRGAQRDFAGGFCAAHDLFSTSWPARSLSADDRYVLSRFEAAEGQGFEPADLNILGPWIRGRHDRNLKGPRSRR